MGSDWRRDVDLISNGLPVARGALLHRRAPWTSQPQDFVCCLHPFEPSMNASQAVEDVVGIGCMDRTTRPSRSCSRWVSAVCATPAVVDVSGWRGRALGSGDSRQWQPQVQHFTEQNAARAARNVRGSAPFVRTAPQHASCPPTASLRPSGHARRSPAFSQCRRVTRRRICSSTQEKTEYHLCTYSAHRTLCSIPHTLCVAPCRRRRNISSAPTIIVASASPTCPAAGTLQHTAHSAQ